MRDIPKPELKKSQIPQPKALRSGKIKFSFQHLISDHNFDYHNSNLKICEFVDRLKHHCSQSKIEFCTDYSKTTRNHPVDEHRIAKSMKLEALQDVSIGTIYQFSMGNKGRVFGFFYDDLFIVRLLDVNHQGYSKK